MTMLAVSVTAEDIARGERRKSWQCPVALAVNRAFCGATSEEDFLFVVGKDTVIFFASYPSPRPSIELPPPAREWIAHFDLTGQGQPFDFELEAP